MISKKHSEFKLVEIYKAVSSRSLMRKAIKLLGVVSDLPLSSTQNLKKCQKKSEYTEKNLNLTKM